MKLKDIHPGDQLLWRHTRRSEVEGLARRPQQLQRTITVKAVFESYVKTDFGDYFIEDGRNLNAPCGCNRFCNCYGAVEPPSA